MKTKHFTALLLYLFFITGTMGQKRQTDKHIVHQQERMAHKQWDRKKFTPTSGFLGLNYQYWLTWAWHPNYPKTDRRPLSVTGPQTLRMGMVFAMQQIAETYKKDADTVRNVAVIEGLNYSGLVTDADPLWLLYYSREFENLIDRKEADPLAGLSLKVGDYLKNKGLLEWYNEERAELGERLQATRTTTLDRGSRIMAYHRLLGEHKKLLSAWEAKKNYAAKFLSLATNRNRLRSDNPDYLKFSGDRSDVQIAQDILKRTQ